jgi:hypothetical protein
MKPSKEYLQARDDWWQGILMKSMNVRRRDILNYFNHLYNRRIANKIYHEEFAEQDAHGRYWTLHNKYHTDPNNWPKI